MKTKRIVLLQLMMIVTCLSAQPQLKIVEQPTENEKTIKGDGLLTSHWTQNYPYNSMCPMDPVTNAACYAGCPAIAMGQIINYLKTTNGTRFDDNDDYHHNYDRRVYDIDDDWETLGFPSFDMLNSYLDEVDSIFSVGGELESKHEAAIVFACGTACQQVYTSVASGTFIVDQAYEAFRRFGFENCVLFGEPTEAMHTLLQDNLAHGYPALLAVESEDQRSGHNLVVDGYRESDNKYHMNFGYGGSVDGWYSIPDSNFYYGLTRMEGIILNIIPIESSVVESVKENIEVYPNPAQDVIYLNNLPKNEAEYVIYNVMGQRVMRGSINEKIVVSNLCKGLYIIKIGNLSSKFIVE